MDIKTNYRGYEISFCEGSSKEDETWRCELGEKWNEKNSFHDIKKKIDEHIKTESIYTNKEVYYSGWSNSFPKGIVTSEDRNGKEAWIKDKDGARTKISKDYLYSVDMTNTNIIDEMSRIDKNIEELRTKKEILSKNMNHFFKD